MAGYANAIVDSHILLAKVNNNANIFEWKQSIKADFLSLDTCTGRATAVEY